MRAKSLQSCLILCVPMDHSLPGSSVHGILQARILEWVSMPFSRGSSQPRDRTQVSLCLLHWQVGSLPLAPSGKPIIPNGLYHIELFLRVSIIDGFSPNHLSSQYGISQLSLYIRDWFTMTSG